MKQKNKKDKEITLEDLSPDERQALIATLGGCAMTCVVFLLIVLIIGAIAYMGKS